MTLRVDGVAISSAPAAVNSDGAPVKPETIENHQYIKHGTFKKKHGYFRNICFV